MVAWVRGLILVSFCALCALGCGDDDDGGGTPASSKDGGEDGGDGEDASKPPPKPPAKDGGTKKPDAGKSHDSGTAPKAADLPALEVKADTPNLLLTWIDDKGDFHVVQKPADVPTGGRATVRVVVTNREEGTGAQVYVANLDETTPTGAYRLKTMSRAEWEELGASKRKARAKSCSCSTGSTS